MANANFKNGLRPDCVPVFTFGDKITAYYFPADGYFIPQSLSAAVNDRPAAKWVFLFAGVEMAALVSLLGLWRFKRPPRSDFPGSISDAIRNRMRQA
jgi:hypothetical protein